MQVFKNLTAKINNAARQFDQDQDGMETMQVVMIIAVAAIVMFFVQDVWYAVAGWTSNLIANVIY